MKKFIENSVDSVKFLAYNDIEAESLLPVSYTQLIHPDAQAKDASGQREKDGAVAVKATISGILRGLIRDGYPVTKGFKIADIDPRESEYENCFTISDKARAIGGSVLEALLYLEQKQGF